MLLYLDWNVFDRIEKRNTLPEEEKKLYSKLAMYIFDNEDVVKVPYSNAHLRDLRRGYDKNPEFISGHLSILHALTSNLLFCQYWKKKEITVHYRDVAEFFFHLLNEEDVKIDNYDTFPETCEEPELREDLSAKKVIYSSQYLPEVWKSVYKEDPIFSLMYPKAKKENTVWALACDINNWSNVINQDYAIYRHFKSVQNRLIAKLRKQFKTFKRLHPNDPIPKYLNLDEMVEELDALSNTDIATNNVSYNKLMTTFYKYDIKGYKSDKNFNSMIDDGLHTFYASYCEYFLSLDERCRAKASKTYERLKYPTKVMTPQEFVEQVVDPYNISKMLTRAL